MLAEDLMVPATTVINGTEITYYDSKDAKGREEVLVLVHGTSGSTAGHFGFIFPVMAAKQRVVSIDLADVSGPQLELSDLVEQVTGFIEQQLAGQQVVLLGYSLGAVVSAAAAAARPELVSRLVLVAGWMKTDLQQQLRNDVWQELRAAGAEEALRRYTIFCAFGGPFLGTKTLQEMRPGMDAMGFDAFGDKQMELNRHIDIVEQAHSILAQTLVIGCTHDQMVPVRHQKALFGAIENASYAEIPTGHAVVFERPSELSHHIQRFMDAPQEFIPGSIIPVPAP